MEKKTDPIITLIDDLVKKNFSNPSDHKIISTLLNVSRNSPSELNQKIEEILEGIELGDKQ